jgi:hypothetical protein
MARSGKLQDKKGSREGKRIWREKSWKFTRPLCPLVNRKTRARIELIAAGGT